jgi:hypothetical protein
VTISVVITPLSQFLSQLQSAFTLFLSLLVEAIPFLLLGVLLSSFLLIFIDERRLIQLLPKHPILGAVVGSLVGFLFPVCECGNVPVARRLILQGAPVSVAIAFLFAAPTINPVVIWATWTAFRDQPEMVWLRIALSWVIATTLGVIFSVQKDLRPFLQPSVARALKYGSSSPSLVTPQSLVSDGITGTFFLGEGKQPLNAAAALEKYLATKAAQNDQSKSGVSLDPVAGTNGSHLNQSGMPSRDQSRSWRNQWSQFFKPTAGSWQSKVWLLLDNTIAELRELGAILVFGSAIAAILQVWVPREVVLSLGQGPVTSVVAMMTLAAVVSVCSTVDAFFALSFASTFTGGSLLGFLVFGPMIDLKSIGLILTIFRQRAVAYMFLLAAQMTFVACLFLNLQIR